jgi:large subunit ribosomal protein L32
MKRRYPTRVPALLIFYTRYGRVGDMSIRMRHTRGHTGNRRSHHALKDTTVVTDQTTGTKRLPHRLDETTGMYRGRQIAPAKAPRATKERVKGVGTEPVAPHLHEQAHVEHANAADKGIVGKVVTGGKPKARSGMGGGA